MQRNGSVDYARYIGALGIVLFHMGLPYGWVGLAALPMFVTLIVYFGAHKPLSHHIRRLLVPWAVWSLIYGALKIAQALVEGHPIASEFELWMVFTGCALHLWFLPFCVLFFAVVKAASALPHPGLYWGLGGITALAALALVNGGMTVIPLNQWASVWPAALLGLVMRHEPWRIAAMGGTLVLMAGLIALGWHEATWQIALATAVLMAAMALVTPETRGSRLCAESAFGVYLVHPLVLAALAYVLTPRSWALFAVAVVLSTALTFVLKRVAPRMV